MTVVDSDDHDGLLYGEDGDQSKRQLRDLEDTWQWVATWALRGYFSSTTQVPSRAVAVARRCPPSYTRFGARVNNNASAWELFWGERATGEQERQTPNQAGFLHVRSFSSSSSSRHSLKFPRNSIPRLSKNNHHRQPTSLPYTKSRQLDYVRHVPPGAKSLSLTVIDVVSR